MKASKGQPAAMLLVLTAIVFAFSFPAFAQQPKKVPRVGYLTGTREPTQDA